MKIISRRVSLNTRGSGDFINVTRELLGIINDAGLRNGTMTIFVSGSTAGVTTFEYEPGLIRDLAEFYEKMAPSRVHYHHDDTWGDANGFGHVRAAFTGPSLVVPFEDGDLLLGAWQQVVLAEFDNKPRKRELVVQLMGE
jgi:secondary thiamine-phosphate synthase enzyme